MRNESPEPPQTDEQTTPSSDDQSRIDRRQFLGTIGAGGLVASAGCLTTLPAFGQRVRFGEVSEPAFGPPQYQTWIPALRDDVVDRVDDVASITSVEYVEPGNMGAELLGAPYGGDRVKRMMEYVGIEFEAFDWAVTAQGNTVASGSVDRDAVETTLAQTGYERDGTYQGYDLYKRTDTRRVLGIAEDRVLFNGYIEEPYRYLRRLIDAGAGRTARRHETDDDFAQMTAAAAARPVTQITGGRFEIDGTEAVLQAETLSTDGSSVYPGRLFLFPAGHDISRGDIERHIEQFPEALDATRVSVSVDGRIVSGIAEMTPETFLELEDVYERPLITWGVEFDEASDEVTVRHEAGGSIDASRLRVHIENLEIAWDEEGRLEPTANQFEDVTSSVDPGTELTVDVSDPERWQLRIHGEVPDGGIWNEFMYFPTEQREEY